MTCDHEGFVLLLAHLRDQMTFSIGAASRTAVTQAIAAATTGELRLEPRFEDWPKTPLKLGERLKKQAAGILEAHRVKRTRRRIR